MIRRRILACIPLALFSMACTSNVTITEAAVVEPTHEETAKPEETEPDETEPTTLEVVVEPTHEETTKPEETEPDETEPTTLETVVEPTTKPEETEPATLEAVVGDAHELVEAILDATLAVELIEFEANQHVRGWTSLKGEGTIHPGTDEAFASTYFADLDQPTVDLLDLGFSDGVSTISQINDPSQSRLGDGGLADVLFTIDSFAEGATLREFFEDILIQTELEVVQESVLDDSDFTRLVDVDRDDRTVVEVLIDGQGRLRRLDLTRVDLSGEETFDQWAIFTYPNDDPAQSIGVTPPDLPPIRSPEISRLAAEDTELCAGLDAIYTARLDLRHSYSSMDREEIAAASNVFHTTSNNVYNVYDIQQLMREAAIDDAYFVLGQLEQVVFGHLFNGVPGHELPLAEAEAAADRFGRWAVELCSDIPAELIDLPDILPLLTPPTPETIGSGRAAFCSALLEVFDARDNFRAIGVSSDGQWNDDTQSAWVAFTDAVDNAIDVHQEAGFVTEDPELFFLWRVNALVGLELHVRQALFVPAAPADEVFLRLGGEHVELITDYVEDDCDASVAALRADVAYYNSNEKSSHFVGNSHLGDFCASGEQELLLRRAFRGQLLRLEPGDEDGLVNAHTLLRRMVQMARGTRLQLYSHDNETDYSGDWWMVSTIEWTVAGSLPVPEPLPWIDDDSYRPFEPSHDPVPDGLDAQRAAILDMQAERDDALALATELCGFPSDLTDMGDDVALLEQIWDLHE